MSRIVLVILGALLITIFVGVCVTIAVGHTVPDALWVVGTGLVGALLGVLLPRPSSRAAARASALSVVSSAADAAVVAARRAAAAIEAEEGSTVAATQTAQAAVRAVIDESGEAVDAVRTGRESAARASQRLATTLRKAESASREAASRTAAAAARPLQGGFGTPIPVADVNEAAATAVEDKRRSEPDLASAGTPTWRLGLAALAILVVGGLAVAVAVGALHPAQCPLVAPRGGTDQCDSDLLQVGTALLALAAGGVGTALGLFVAPPSVRAVDNEITHR